MKYILVILSLLFASDINSQIDKQWYVRNGYGLDNELFNFPLSPSQDFSIKGVRHPFAGNNSVTEANDVFIIYEDGQFYSSDLDNFSLHVFYSPNVYGNIGYSYEFPNAVSSRIKYLYFTNKYEEDDPYENIKVSQDPEIIQVPIGISNLGQNLWTHQDITPNNDIVVVVNQLAIKDSILSCGVKLCFGKTVHPITGVEKNINLQASNIFESQGGLGNAYSGIKDGHDQAISPVVISGQIRNCIELNSNDLSPYKFINLRADFLSQTFSLINEIPHQAVFDLYCGDGSEPFDSFEVDIRSSHDPNFVRLKSICKNSNNEEIANYRIQFQNDASDNASGLVVTCDLPSCLDPSTVCVTDWQAGLEKMNNQSSAFANYKLIGDNVLGQTIEFVFHQDHSLCTDVLDQCSIGYIEFCAKGVPSCDLQICPLQIEYPYTTFDSQDYPVHDFFDIDAVCIQNMVGEVTYEECTRSFSDNCECECEDDDNKGCWFINLFKKKKKKSKHKKGI